MKSFYHTLKTLRSALLAACCILACALTASAIKPLTKALRVKPKTTTVQRPTASAIARMRAISMATHRSTSQRQDFKRTHARTGNAQKQNRGGAKIKPLPVTPTAQLLKPLNDSLALRMEQISRIGLGTRISYTNDSLRREITDLLHNQRVSLDSLAH